MKDYDPLIPDSELSKQGAFLLAQNDGCAVWQFRSGSGDGTMTVYDVFPGVMLSFNDFHMAQYESRYVASRSLFAVDHCREGRMEYAAGENAVAYIGAGDMKLDLRKQHTGVFRFPSSHYHGLTVAMDLDIVRNSLPGQIRDFPADPDRIIARWQLGDYPRVVHGVDVMEHIFSEMYRVPEKIRIPYFKVKILPVSGYHQRSGQRRPAALFLPHPGGEGAGHPGLSGGAHLRELHPGGVVPAVRPAADAHEGLLPLRLRRVYRRMAHRPPDEPRRGAADKRPESRHRRDRRHGGLRQPQQVRRRLQKGHEADAVGISKGKRDLS